MPPLAAPRRDQRREEGRGSYGKRGGGAVIVIVIIMLSAFRETIGADPSDVSEGGPPARYSHAICNTTTTGNTNHARSVGEEQSKSGFHFAQLESHFLTRIEKIGAKVDLS